MGLGVKISRLAYRLWPVPLLCRSYRRCSYKSSSYLENASPGTVGWESYTVRLQLLLLVKSLYSMISLDKCRSVEHLFLEYCAYNVVVGGGVRL